MAPAPLTDGGIADVRIYRGHCSSNNLEVIRTFSTGFVDDGSGAVLTQPVITLQPASGNTHPGGSRTFTVGATGGNLSYYWSTNSVAVAGANSASLTLSSIPQSFNNLQVACLVSNSVGTILSSNATLTVVPVSTPYAAAVMALNPYVYYHLNEASNSSSVAISDYVNGLDGADSTPAYAVFGPGVQPPSYPGFPASNGSIGNGGITNVNQLNLGVLPSFTNGMTLCGWVYVSSGITNANNSTWGAQWPIIFAQTGVAADS